MMSPEKRLEAVARWGLVKMCMPVPPPAERDLRCGAQVALNETLARIDDAGRRFAQRLLRAHTD
ncbi:MAG: hypothetical protein ACK4UU_05975 [Fimbriimonadales bacterium]